MKVDEGGILLRIRENRSVQIGKEEILRIASRSGGKGALIGLGIMAGGGAAIFAARPPGDLYRSEGTVMGAGLGGLIGAIAGGIIGKEQTLYRALKSPVQPQR